MGLVEIAPTVRDTNVGLIDAPGLIGRLEMTAQQLLQFRTVALDPALDCRVVRLQAAFAEQFFDIAERERVPQVPAHGAKNQLAFGLSPLEDRRSDCLFHDRFRLPAAIGQSCNTTISTAAQRTNFLQPLGERPDGRSPHRSQISLYSHANFNANINATASSVGEQSRRRPAINLIIT